ncbi:YphA family membrane protein [Evansella halocellulosilytica]
MIDALFYWSIWLMIISYFFFDENKMRRELYTTIGLLIVITSLYTFPIFGVYVNVALLLIIVIVFSFIRSLSKYRQMYLLFLSFLLTGVYVWVQYFLYIEPVWMFVSPNWVITSVYSLFTIVLLKKPEYRWCVISISVIVGECLTVAMLYYYSHTYTYDYVVGHVTSLAIIFMSILTVSIWKLLEQLALQLKIRITNSISRKTTLSQRKVNA